jgi:hypothetical protein
MPAAPAAWLHLTACHAGPAPAAPPKQGCPPFSHLTITGGAIGCGPPMALGAALAAPGRRVINLQADGSAMYTLQVMTTRARQAKPNPGPLYLLGTGAAWPAVCGASLRGSSPAA